MLRRLKYFFIPVMLLAYSVNSNGQTSSYGELQTATAGVRLSLWEPASH